MRLNIAEKAHPSDTSTNIPRSISMSNNQQDKQAQRNQRIKATLSKNTFGYLDACEYTDEDESPILELLQYFEEVTKELRECHLPVFRLIQRQGQRGQYTLKRGSDVDRILQAVELIPQLQYLCPDHEFNPYVDSFLNKAYHNDVEGITRDQVSDRETIDRLNNFVNDVIKDISSREFRLKRRRCRESVVKNAKSIEEYIDALFKRFPRLLVIRVDFGYQKRRITNPDYGLDLLDVLDDKERMINYVKRQYGDALVGHAWKMEHGILKSYHYHMVFFLNGRERRGDFHIARQLGEHWVYVITQGDGTTFNCNAKKNKYSELAIGMVRRDDQLKREFLKDHVVDYLTKNDDYMRLKIETHGEQIRTFGRGVMPAEKSPSR